MVDLGCLCAVDKKAARTIASSSEAPESFDLDFLQFKTLASYHYLPEGSFRTIYLYQHKAGNKSVYGLFVPATKKATVFAVDTVKSNQVSWDCISVLCTISIGKLDTFVLATDAQPQQPVQQRARGVRQGSLFLPG